MYSLDYLSVNKIYNPSRLKPSSRVYLFLPKKHLCVFTAEIRTEDRCLTLLLCAETLLLGTVTDAHIFNL